MSFYQREAELSLAESAAGKSGPGDGHEPEALMPAVGKPIPGTDPFNPPLEVAVPTRPKGGWRGRPAWIVR
jgi:hypothetical protein